MSVAAPFSLESERHTIGDLEVTTLHDGTFWLDGGAMYGVVPRVVWERQTPADASHRIPLTMRPLLVRGRQTLLIDAGMGDKESDAFYAMYAADRSQHLDHALAAVGVSPEDIDIVLATHLHFDHAGGFTVRDAHGTVRPRFPRARYVVHRGEWEDAVHPHARSRASYRPDNFLPLAEAGVLDVIDGDGEVMPGVRVERTGGHTAHHMVVWCESGGSRALYAADLIPTAAHLPDTWVMGYDLYPVDALAAKHRITTQVIADGTRVFFEHDPRVASGIVQAQGRARVLVDRA